MTVNERATEFPTLRRSDSGGRVVLVPGRMESTERYEIGESIARGGMGEIFVARDHLIGRDVAIKRLRGEVADTALERFMREACIQGRLEHPAIVPVHELGVDRDGVPFFVMKKLTGTTLRHIIASPDPARHSRQRLLRAFVDICLAVEFAHAGGCIHRDLKPDNIVLGQFGEVYVIDWGVAKLLGTDDEPSGQESAADPTSTQHGVAIGTAGYMAPEQARGDRDLDARADVYGLGCVLFEILAGDSLHPRGEDGMHSALRGVDARPSVRAPDRDIPPELDAICVRATAVERGDRPATARALAEMVERFLDGDRDLAQRKQLASAHLEKATIAFADGEQAEARRTAMRLAGRALALDPTLAPAAELVGRLMLEPPRAIPEEVTRTLNEDRAQARRHAARFGMYAYAGYVAMLALLANGFTSPVYPIVFAGLILINVGLLASYIHSRADRSPLPALIASAAIIAFVARVFSPFFIAPGVAAVTAMGFMQGMMHGTLRSAVTTIVVMSAAILIPWAAEDLGWVSHTFESQPDFLTIYANGLDPGKSTGVGVLAAYTVVLVATAVLMTHLIGRASDGDKVRLHLQAWQLRQLLPRPHVVGS